MIAMSNKDAVDLKVLTANMHVGQAVTPGWAAQVHLLKPDIILCQEVIGKAVGELAHLLRNKYRFVPSLAHREGRESTQTPILVRRGRLELLTQGNKQISEWLGGGEHDRLWPTRFGTQARLLDMETQRIINARAVHTWALGPSPPHAVVDGHERQVDSVAQWARSKPLDHIVLAGGDWNENLDNVRPGYAVRAMTDAGMMRAGQGRQPAEAHTSLHGPAYLDDVFFKGIGVKVKDHAIIRNAGTGADHRMVCVTFAVQPMTHR